MKERIETLKAELENYVVINAQEIPKYYDYNMKFKAASKINIDVCIYIENWENENNYHIDPDELNNIYHDLTEIMNKIIFE